MEYNHLVHELELMQECDENGIIIKYIPEYGKEKTGVLDPRVREDRIRMMKEAEHSGPVDYNDLEAMRAAMGWPNQDVTEAILTEHRIIQGTHGDIPVRIYRPEGQEKGPCMVFFHGGGFYGGSVDCVENPCKCLAENAGCVVVSVDYRLAPEHPFPEGFDDCYDVVKELYEKPELYGICADEIGVAGDSAGGNLAAACSLKDRNEETHMIRFTALLYPSVDMGRSGRNHYSWSLDDYNIGEDRELIMDAIYEIGSEDTVRILTDLYLGGDRELTNNEYVSPLMTSNGKDLPPTMLLMAEYDYLTPEGKAYGTMLKKDGVPVNMILYKGVDHAFIDKIGQYPQGEDGMKEIARMFLTVLRPSNG